MSIFMLCCAVLRFWLIIKSLLISTHKWYLFNEYLSTPVWSTFPIVCFQLEANAQSYWSPCEANPYTYQTLFWCTSQNLAYFQRVFWMLCAHIVCRDVSPLSVAQDVYKRQVFKCDLRSSTDSISHWCTTPETPLGTPRNHICARYRFPRSHNAPSRLPMKHSWTHLWILTGLDIVFPKKASHTPVYQ